MNSKKTLVIVFLGVTCFARAQWSPLASETNFITTPHISATNDFGLNLEADGNYRYVIENNLNGVNRQAFYFGHANSTKNIFGIGTSGDSGTSWTPRLAMTQNGHMGIGTSTPLSKLTITSNAQGAPHHSFADVTVEDSARAMINLSTQSNGTGYYGFSDVDDSYVGGIQYDHASEKMIFRVNNHATPDAVIDANGNMGIGTSSPGSYRLAVKGKIRAEEIKVETGWADYVFEDDYDLPTLEEVEKHIMEKGHLINIPSAKEVKENGIQLGEMNKLLLEKIEELTLYVIELKKEINLLKQDKK